MKKYMHPKIYKTLVKFSDGSISCFYTYRQKKNKWSLYLYQKDIFNHDLWKRRQIDDFFQTTAY